MADANSRSGAYYVNESVLEYVDRVHAAHSRDLEAAFTAADGDRIPAIQVSPSEGRFLELLARLCKATRIIEIGTLTGYSAIRLALGMEPGGHLWTIEFDEHHADVARQNIAAAGLSDRVTVVVGSANECLPELEMHGPFDLVFIDADKDGYPSYGAWATKNLRQGGVLVGDNAFLFGHLLEDSERGRAMRTFHEEAAATLMSACIPTPEGMLIAIKGT